MLASQRGDRAPTELVKFSSGTTEASRGEKKTDGTAGPNAGNHINQLLKKDVLMSGWAVWISVPPDAWSRAMKKRVPESCR